MTLLVGIVCKDGIILGADSAATFASDGMPTIGQQMVRKIHNLSDRALYCSAGAVGISQIIAKEIDKGLVNKQLTPPGLSNPEEVMHLIGRQISTIVTPYLQSAVHQRQSTGECSSSLCKSLIALPVKNTPCLFSFDYNGAPERCTKELPFIALGSGQVRADPFLAFLKRLLWKDEEPTIAEGRLVAAWTINHVRQIDPGGVGGGIQLATLSLSGGGKSPVVTMIENDGIEEHLQQIASAEKVFVEAFRGNPATPPAPTGLPTPPSS